MSKFYEEVEYQQATDTSLGLQAVPLIASPTMIAALLSPEVREASSKQDDVNGASLEPRH